MNCPFCGKAIRPHETECPYCGNPVPHPSDVEDMDASEWLEQMKQLEQLLCLEPSAFRTTAGLLALFAGGILFGFLAILFLFESKEPFLIQLFLLVFAVVSVLMVVGAVWGLLKLLTSRAQRIHAIVVGKRHEHSQDDDSGALHYLTVQTKDAHRNEYSVSADLFGRVEKGYVGVAYIKGGYLLDFKPVPLPIA